MNAEETPGENEPRDQGEMILLMRLNDLQMQRDAWLTRAVSLRCERDAISENTTSQAKRARRVETRKEEAEARRRAGEYEAQIQAFVLKIARAGKAEETQ